MAPDRRAPDTSEMNVGRFVLRGALECRKPLAIIQPRLRAWSLASSSLALLLAALGQAPRCFSP
eukprot:666462-Pyramimonas_sp.AAC.1